MRFPTRNLRPSEVRRHEKNCSSNVVLAACFWRHRRSGNLWPNGRRHGWPYIAPDRVSICESWERDDRLRTDGLRLSAFRRQPETKIKLRHYPGVRSTRTQHVAACTLHHARSDVSFVI